jgi:tight adherence protein B
MTTVVVAALGCWLTVVLVRLARRVEGGARARGLGERSRWRMPGRLRSRLERALTEAAVEVEPETAVEVAAMGVAATVLLAFAVAPGLVPVVAGLTILAGPVGLRLARGRAERRFVAALPGGLEQVAAALRGGAAVGEALLVLGRSPALAADVQRVRARAELGLGLPDALAAWPRERPLPEVRAVAGSLAVASTLGGRSADALDGLAASLRERLGALAEARALSSHARLSAVVVGGAPIAYLAFSAVIDPSSVDLLVGTDIGRVCLVLGLGCEVLAALWMRRILRRGAAG